MFKTDDGIITVSANEILTFMECPTKYYLRYVLDLKGHQSDVLKFKYEMLDKMVECLKLKAPIEQFEKVLEQSVEEFSRVSRTFLFEAEQKQALNNLRKMFLRYYEFEAGRFGDHVYRKVHGCTLNYKGIRIQLPPCVFIESGSGYNVIKYDFHEPKLSPKARLPENKPENCFELALMYAACSYYRERFRNLTPYYQVGYYHLMSKDDKAYDLVPLFESKPNKNIVMANFKDDSEALAVIERYLSEISLNDLENINQINLQSFSCGDCSDCKYRIACSVLRANSPAIVQSPAPEKQKSPAVSLDEYQKQAITSEGIVRIVAPPGSGKTTVLMKRYEHLIKKVSPQKILFLSFTKEAVSELRKRAEKIVPPSEAENLSIFTFHGFCSKLLKKLTNYEAPVLEEATLSKWIVEFLNQSPLKGVSYANPLGDFGIVSKITKTVYGWVSSDVECDLESYIQSLNTHPWTVDGSKEWLKDLFDYIINKKNSLGYITYPEQLQRIKDIFLSNPKIVDTLPYDYIMVDEYQDTNDIQELIVSCIARSRNGRDLCVCGDEDQSIYRFRGVEIKHFIDFHERHPGCKDIILRNNYRSVRPIVDFTQFFISNNQNRIKNFGDVLAPRSGPIDAVRFEKFEKDDITPHVEYIKECLNAGYSFSDIAIIARRNSTIENLKEKLRNVGIPAELSQKDIRDFQSYYCLMAMLEALFEPSDISDCSRFAFESILGVSLESAKLSFVEAVSGDKELYEIETAMPLLLSLIKAEEPVINFLNELVDKDGIKTLYDLFYRIREGIIYREDFTVDCSCPGSVTLITAHGSKGHEYPVVVLYDTNDFKVKADSADSLEVEEERRVLYVALTRAKDRLFVGISHIDDLEPLSLEIIESYKKVHSVMEVHV